MKDNLIIALQIMGQGMLGIFVSILLIMLVIYILSKTGCKNSSADQAK